MSLRVRDLIGKTAGRSPLIATLNTPVSDVARMMRESDRDSVIVFDLDRAMGIVTERDLLTKVTAEGRDPMKVRVDDVISSPLITAHPSTSLEQAKALMVKKNIHHLPVVSKKGEGDDADDYDDDGDDGTLIGMVTFDDLCRVG